ncbi:MAG: galactokinase [Gammaproteobacteria bacterium]|nr:galactokinase [Gammaproteobacteria bacterium]
MLFTTKYDAKPTGLVRVPGRVNLIGEHTDYNGGYVLPMAIERAIWIAFRPRSDRKVFLRSEAFVDEARLDLDELTRGEGWAEYAKGVAWAMEKAGNRLQGWEGVIASDIAMAAGLSSSAAFGIAIEVVFAEVSDLGWDPGTFAQLQQHSENEWVGVRSGIMDPLIVTGAHKGHAMLIDCLSFKGVHVPIPPEAAIVVMDTGTRRNLIEAGYNRRRSQCEVAAAKLGVTTLRDVTMARLNAHKNDLGESLYECAKHVVTENERTLAAKDALLRGALGEFGSLMNESHTSLRDSFGVSSRPLDAMVEAAQSTPGCFGARLTGGGYAGAAIALVTRKSSERFIHAVEDAFHEATGLQGHCYVVESAHGASFEPI